mgnify:CR=1 FL=1
MASQRAIKVQVCYALPTGVSMLDLQVEEGATLEAVIRRSGLLVIHPEIDLSSSKIGIFGKIGQLSDTVRADDRIEIYRPLQADPKESRRRRAKHKVGK